MCRRRPLYFDGVIPLGGYEDRLREVVLQMKRPRGVPLAKVMGQFLTSRRRAQLADVRADLIVPIPMHWSRRLQRGTNSPEILARCVARRLGIPLGRRLLVRCRQTALQADLTPAERFRNVRGAFIARELSSIKGANILLMDDILTTGATCSEAARMLKKVGAASVTVAVLEAEIVSA